MSEDYKKEDLMLLSQAYRLVEGMTLKPCCEKTIRNWAHHGRRAPHGERIYLRTVGICGHDTTTEKWLREFLEELRNG